MPKKASVYPTKMSQKNRAASVYASTQETSLSNEVWTRVQDFLPVVKSTVARMRIYFPENVESQDIYSIGLTALIHAARKFDASKSQTFPAYAKIRVRGALLDELRRLDTLTRDDRARWKQFQSQVDGLTQNLGHLPSQAEVCEHLKISQTEYSRLQQVQAPVITPLDCVGVSESNALPLHEIISDPTEQNPCDLMENSDLVESLKECLKQLDATSQEILSLYYLEELRLAEIAHIFGLTESRICQLHSKAIIKLRVLLKSKFSP